MTPEQKLFYLSLYLGAEVILNGKRCQLVGVGLLNQEVTVDMGGDTKCLKYRLLQIDYPGIKLILKEEPASYHEDDKANKAYWEAYHGNETLCGKLYTGLRYDKLAGILWLIKNKYDIFNLKSQDLAIYENDLCTK